MKIFLSMVFLETLQILCIKLCKIWGLDYHTVLSKSWDIQLPPTGHMKLPELKNLLNIYTHTYIYVQKVKFSFHLTQHGSHICKMFTV